MRGWARPRVPALLALAAFCGIGLVGEARAELPCGILQPVDAILCAGGSPNVPPGTSGSQPGSSPGTAAPGTAPGTAPPDTSGSQPESSQVRPASGGVRRTGPRPELVPDLLLVRFVPGSGPARRATVLSQAGATEERTIRPLGVTVARVRPERLAEARAALERSRWVKGVERDVVVRGIGGQARLGPARDRGRSAARAPAPLSTLVAVIDTGVDRSHPSLAGAVVGGFDFVNSDQDASDDYGHGTAVAGIIAGRTSQAAGVCSSCVVVPVKVLGADGSGSTSTVAAGIVYAVDQGVRVINLSLGSPGTSQLLSDAVAYAAARNVLLVAAAGNEGVSTPFYPAAHAPALSVAATTASDQLYSWSNFGDWVAVAALGCRAAPVSGGYGEFCGTSASAPIVAGLAGRMVASNPSAAAADVARALESTAQPIGPVVRYGRVRPNEALSTLTPAPAIRTDTFRGSLTPRISGRVYIFGVEAGPLKATLRFAGASRLTLALLDARGARIAKTTGRSPVEISKTLAAATYRVVVSGARARTTYTLVLSHS
jgi:hypothetical protein